jgi:hypothetical protein
MAYEEDRDMDLDEANNFEDDPVYGADTYFGERLDTADDMGKSAMDETVVASDKVNEDGSEEIDAVAVESDDPAGFGETLSTQTDEETAAKPSDED